MAHRDLGIVYAEQDRKQDAVAEFQAAIRLAPKIQCALEAGPALTDPWATPPRRRPRINQFQNLNKAEDEHLLKVMSAIPGGEHKSTPAPQK